MKSTLTMKPESTTQPAIFKPTTNDTFVERIQKISATIKHRAYDLFQARGADHGHDREDWFRAESELLTPLATKLVEADGGFTVRADVPGFSGKDVEVLVEPMRLTIHAKKQELSQQETGDSIRQEQVSNEILRTVDLPKEIDPDHTTATIKNEVLEVALPRFNPGKKTSVGAKAA